MANRISWYWSRLTCMSPREVAYRLRKTALIQAQRVGLFTAEGVATKRINEQGKTFVRGTRQVQIAVYQRAADDILNGQLSIFALEKNRFSPLTDWNRDPRTGRDAPLVFGKSINYRDQEIVGDIKYLWEPNRHLHLVTLAQAYFLTKENSYIDELATQLDSWMEQCPYPDGPNWTSSLELAIRLINWSIIWQLIGERQSPLFEGQQGSAMLGRWEDSIYQHLHFIQGHLSKYSSANNHLIGEAAGLFVAATIWPYWEECESWRETARKILEQEALLQNAEDGVNKEQAISYQQFVLDFLILSGLAGRANGNEFSGSYWERIETMMEYLASVMDSAGNVPMIGDADDGYVVRLSCEHDWCPYRSLLSTGAALFKRGDFKAKAGRLDDKTRWILGDQGAEAYKTVVEETMALPVHQAFPEGGYYILGCDFETDNEIRMVADAGPIGYEGIAAHGHADALAFTLNVAGREFLIDPGTYAYHTQKKWRDYFRGTSAHNTLRIDAQDQSVSGGNFMWLKKANAWCETWESNREQDRFVAMHDGYTRLDDPVVHRREILLRKVDRKIIVKDFLSCKGTHTVEGFWHFPEHCRVSVAGKAVEAVNAGRSIAMKLADCDSEYEIVAGDEQRPLGWVSRRFDVKVPAAVVVWRVAVHGETAFTTEIICS